MFNRRATLFNRYTLWYFPYHLIDVHILLSIRYNSRHLYVLLILSGSAIQTARVGFPIYSFSNEIFLAEKSKFRRNPVPWTRKIPKYSYYRSLPYLTRTHHPPHFVTINQATTAAIPSQHPHHHALIFKTLTIYRHKSENQNPKIKSTV